MRKRDKLKNMEEANLMLEQTYLDSKTLFTEENTKQIIKEICVNVNKKFNELLGKYKEYNKNKNLGIYFQSLKSVCNRPTVDEKELKKVVNNFLHQYYYEPNDSGFKMIGWGPHTPENRFDNLLRKITKFKGPNDEERNKSQERFKKYRETGDISDLVGMSYDEYVKKFGKEEADKTWSEK